ncbi:putative membrane protein [Priestia megaterium]|nr:putative membrane protein [Priestia megaterium]
MNMGLGVILIFVSIIFILWGLFSRKQKNKLISNALLVVGTIALSISILLLTGIYDPYANHIK